MSDPGETEGQLLIRSRAALLDALDALEEHRDSLIVIGAQAIYLRTVGAPVALAELTKDSDLAVDPRRLRENPRIEDAMQAAGFSMDRGSGQPGSWVSRAGIPLDLMVPELLAGKSNPNARGARIAPHHKSAMRRARGLEAVIVDNDVMEIAALDPADTRRHEVAVAGLAALLVAKIHKLAERSAIPRRLVDKDAHDVYRILIHTETATLARTVRRLLHEQVCAAVVSDSLNQLGQLFADGPRALGSRLAGRAEEGVGEPDTVALQTSILAADLLRAIEAPPPEE